MSYLEFLLYFYPLNTTLIPQTANFDFSVLQLPPAPRERNVNNSKIVLLYGRGLKTFSLLDIERCSHTYGLSFIAQKHSHWTSVRSWQQSLLVTAFQYRFELVQIQMEQDQGARFSVCWISLNVHILMILERHCLKEGRTTHRAVINSVAQHGMSRRNILFSLFHR